MLILAQYDQMMTLMETCQAYGLKKQKHIKNVKKSPSDEGLFFGFRFVGTRWLPTNQYAINTARHYLCQLGSDAQRNVSRNQGCSPKKKVTSKLWGFKTILFLLY